MATIPRPHPARYLQPANIASGNHYETEVKFGIEALYAGHRDAVYRVALRVTRNAADAEDVMQNVFLRMMRNDARPDPGRSPGAYLRRAATNASIDSIRQRAQRAETTIGPLQPAAEEAWAERHHIEQAISRLPARHARLFKLHYRDGYMCSEVAGLLDMQSGAVKSRLHRIRATLQRELQAA